MSLLIDGMDMPKNKGLFYDLLLSLSFDGSGEIFFNGKSYPIAKIPTHHGRLIDADRFLAVIRSAAGYSPDWSVPLSVMIESIENAPTVIEKEG